MQLDEIQRVMADYERQYGMTTVEFVKKYESGTTDDRMDFVEWVSLSKMAVAPHHPGLENFPHHIHSADGEATPGKPTNISAVLDEIEAISDKPRTD